MTEQTEVRFRLIRDSDVPVSHDLDGTYVFGLQAEKSKISLPSAWRSPGVISCLVLLAQQPATVLRLFEGGLSSAGYLQAIRERFWNLLEYSSIEQIKRIWSKRDTLEIGPMERIALIANEFAHGSIDERPWAGASDPAVVFEACKLGVFNLFYLYARMVKTGVDEAPIVRTLGYLILATLRHYHTNLLQELFRVALTNDDGEPMPEKRSTSC